MKSGPALWPSLSAETVQWSNKTVSGFPATDTYCLSQSVTSQTDSPCSPLPLAVANNSHQQESTSAMLAADYVSTRPSLPLAHPCLKTPRLTSANVVM